jgi:hypothetical protein
MCFQDFRETQREVVGDAGPAAPAAGAVALPPSDAPPLIRPPDQAGVVPPAPPAAAAAPAPASPPPPSAPAAPVAPGSPFVPSSNPLAPSLPGSTQPDAVPAPAAPPAPTAAPAADDAAADPAASLTWPCPRCGADAPMTENHCPVCGTGFLADAAGMKTLKAPLIGDLTKMNRVQKLLFGIVIAVGITLGIVALLTIASLLS